MKTIQDNALPHNGGRQTSITFDTDSTETTVDSAANATAQAAAKPQEGWSGLQFVSFGSGSSGNCSYLGNADGGVLIDAGVDPDHVLSSLRQNGVTPKMIKGIVLTHDHADHIRYAYTLVRRMKHLRIYCTPRLMTGMLRHHCISRRIREYQENVFKEMPFKIGEFQFTPFEVSHDATDNMGFMIEACGKKFVVATDMGVITLRAEHYMSQAQFLMIESNYDRAMLDGGRYPEYLKNRVRGPKGHLDNLVAADFVASHYQEGLKYVFLCHLSNDNNTPEIAVKAMTDALTGIGLTVGDASNEVDQRDRDVQVYALPRYDTSTWFVL